MQRLVQGLLVLLVLMVVHSAWALESFPLEALQPGQQGYGLTAGAGNVIERFGVEVLGLQLDVGTGFPVVLIKASGPFIEAAGGVAAGMSGSPVYLPYEGEDALLGAIGYTFPNSEGGLALVTPIETMRRGATAAGLTPFHEELFAALGPAVPVATPLLLAGLSERSSLHLESLLPAGLTPLPIQTGSVSSEADEAYVLEPGSAVSVQLVRGDVTVAAVGTLTAIEGARFLAFGHPLLGRGEAAFALAPAYVSYIVPSRVVPFKLANSGERILGSVLQDRPFAVSGTLGTEPEFIPVVLTLGTEWGSTIRRFGITPDERLLPLLLAAATLQAFDEATERVGAGTTEVAWEIELAGGDTVRVLEQVTDENDIARATAGLVASPLAILADNPFAEPDVISINLNLRFEAAQRYAELIEVVAESEELTPGESLVLHVRLQPYRQEPEVKTLIIPLPDRFAEEDSFEVNVRGGLEPRMEGGDDEDERGLDSEPPILSFSELLVALRENVQSSEVVVETIVDGDYRRLKRLALPYLIAGSETLSITVGGEGGLDPDTGDDLVGPEPTPPEPPLDDDPPLTNEPPD